MRSTRSTRLPRFTPLIPIATCALLVGVMLPAGATTGRAGATDATDIRTTSTTNTTSTAGTTTTTTTTTTTSPQSSPQPPAQATSETSAQVTTLTRTPDGGLSLTDVPATQPRLTARSLNAQPNTTASTVKQRHIFAAPHSDGAARDLQWSLNQLGAEDAWQVSTGTGAVVAVLDTGVDAGHPDLAGRVLPGYDAIRRRAGGMADPNGHGTHVAGSIAGVGAISGIAPNSRILPVRVMNARGGGNTADIAAGIIWAVNNGAHVLNLSLGSKTADRVEESAIRWARSQGVVVIAAVGNSGSSRPMFPASYGDRKRDASIARDPVVGVGATYRTGRRASFSQRGSAVDVTAPGVRVLSTSPRSKGAYAWESGTSMSSPFVAGTAALLISRLTQASPQLTANERAALTINAIRRGSRDRGARGTDKLYGSGNLDAAGALAAVGAPVNQAMVADASLIGGARGRAIVRFTAPAATTTRARLTTTPGTTGAPAAKNPSDGTAVWSGASGESVVLSLPELSMSNSYTLTIFSTRGSATSRTVTGLRPIALKVSSPKSARGAKKQLKIRSIPGPGNGVPGASVNVDFRFDGKRKTTRTSPLSSRTNLVKIPGSTGSVYFSVRVDAGDGNWPSIGTERLIRRRT